ncbi:MAG: hypothetical protein AAF652_11995, partial [Cyanobacteria bacterium P01_C01_bin.72]
PWQVCFCLDAQATQEIEQIIASQSRLVLSPTNLANLRHYALLHLSLEQAPSRSLKQQWAASQSSLTFSTQYSSEAQNSTTLLRSTIDFQGAISQQVQQQLVDDPALLNSLSQAHYWLISEIITQLPLKSATWYSWLIPVVWAMVTLVMSILLGYLLPVSYFLKAVVCVGILCLSKAIYQTVIAKKFKSWVIQQLIDGFLAQDALKRQLGLKLLSLLVGHTE